MTTRPHTIATASATVKELYKLALLNREHSYSPYSGCKVGAAVRTSKGKLFGGCNVENASYGVAICAERTAITKAISELGRVELTDVIVVCDSDALWPPCGACRQFICEFAIPDTKVHLSNLAGTLETVLFEEIFPMGFSPDYLDKAPEGSHSAPRDPSILPGMDDGEDGLH